MHILWAFTAMVAVSFGLLIRPRLLAMVSWVCFWFLLFFVATWVDVFGFKEGVVPDIPYVDQMGYLFPHMLVGFAGLLMSLYLAYEDARATRLRKRKMVEEHISRSREDGQVNDVFDDHPNVELRVVIMQREATVEDDTGLEPVPSASEKGPYAWATHVQRFLSLAALLATAVLLQALETLSVDTRVPWNVIAASVILCIAVVLNVVGYYVYLRRQKQMLSRYDVLRDTKVGIAAAVMVGVYLCAYFIAYGIEVWGMEDWWLVGENAFAVYATVVNAGVTVAGVIWSRGAFATVFSRHTPV